MTVLKLSVYVLGAATIGVGVLKCNTILENAHDEKEANGQRTRLETTIKERCFKNRCKTLYECVDNTLEVYDRYFDLLEASDLTRLKRSKAAVEIANKTAITCANKNEQGGIEK